MNLDILEGKWEEIKGKLKKKWGKLTDDDLLVIKGNRQELLGKIQLRYGCTKAEAQNKVKEFVEKLGDS